jgi:hypothetical protein
MNIIPKSGYRFSEKIMFHEHDPEKWIPVFGKDLLHEQAGAG